MSRPAVINHSARPRARHLRLVTTESHPSTQVEQGPPGGTPWGNFAGRQAAPVLLAGAGGPTRSTVLDELRGLLPAGTRFVQADETWEVIDRASTSGMVVIAGDLRDVSAKSLLKLLSRRYPALPILAVGEKAPMGAVADVDAAGG